MMTRAALALAWLLAVAHVAALWTTAAADSRYTAGAITQAHQRYDAALRLDPWLPAARAGCARCLADEQAFRVSAAQ